VLERVLLYSSHVGDFIGGRLFGLYQVLDDLNDSDAGPETEEQLGAEIARIADAELAGNLLDFFRSPELWLGVLAAGLMLAAAIWVRRYRDETT
jgi:hypothetical protein